ncbi:MAG: alpha/beta hydrolase [Solobacterium sp.]|nr:alpha/beta hydrolase [Solobacterium sp.]
MKAMTLETEKGKLYYVQTEDWKEGADTVFFLHGLTADHTMFEEQFPFFEKEYNVLAWDAPGHGRSRPFEKFGFDDSSLYIRTILDGLNVKSVIFAGQSLGGYFAQSFIKRYPDYVKAFISLGSTPYGNGYYSRSDIWIIKQVGWMAHLYPFEMMKKAMAKQVSTTQAAYDNMLKMLEPYDKNELCHLMGIGYAGFLEDNCDLQIPCPVLLILGEHDRTGKVAQYNRAWTERTGYPLKVIKGAAHNVNVDRPLDVNICIWDFLHSLDNALKKEG